MAEDLNALEPVEVEIDGRTLAGVGVTAEELQEVMERGTEKPAKSAETPATETPEPVTAEAATEPERNADGTFKKAKGRARFSELTAEREQAAQRAETAEAELTRLRAEIETLKRSQQPVAGNGNGNGTGPKTLEPHAGAVAPPPTRPKPKVDEIGTKYQTYEDYTEDLADWKAEQRIVQALPTIDGRIRASIEADRATRSLQETVSAAIDRGRKTYPDFDAVVTASSVVLPWPVIHAIAQHPQSEHLQYTLGKNSQLAQSIAETFPTDPIAAGAMLERALIGSSASAAVPASTARPSVTTNAPAPYQPVGSGTKTTVPPLDQLADHGDDFDTSGYRERRAAERKKRA